MLQTEVLEGLSSIDKRMSNIIDSSKDDYNHQLQTEEPPEPSTNQNPPNSEPENQFFSPTIKELLTLLLSYLLSFIKLNFPLQPTTVPSQVPSNQPSKRNYQRNKNGNRRRHQKNFESFGNSSKNSTASAIYTLNNTIQQYIHLQFPSSKIQTSSLTGNAKFDAWSKRRLKAHHNKTKTKSFHPKAVQPKSSSPPYVPPDKRMKIRTASLLSANPEHHQDLPSSLTKSKPSLYPSLIPPSYFEPTKSSSSSSTSESLSTASSFVDETVSTLFGLLPLPETNPPVFETPSKLKPLQKESSPTSVFEISTLEKQNSNPARYKTSPPPIINATSEPIRKNCPSKAERSKIIDEFYDNLTLKEHETLFDIFLSRLKLTKQVIQDFKNFISDDFEHFYGSEITDFKVTFKCHEDLFTPSDRHKIKQLYRYLHYHKLEYIVQLQNFDFHSFISWIENFKNHSFEQLQTESPFEEPSTVLFQLEEEKEKSKSPYSTTSFVYKEPSKLPSSSTSNDADSDSTPPHRINHKVSFSSSHQIHSSDVVSPIINYIDSDPHSTEDDSSLPSFDNTQGMIQYYANLSSVQEPNESDPSEFVDDNPLYTQGDMDDAMEYSRNIGIEEALDNRSQIERDYY